jgi:hypothetical protein
VSLVSGQVHDNTIAVIVLAWMHLGLSLLVPE